MEIKKNIPNNTITRKLVDLDKDTGNIYESINIIARRANQISTELKAGAYAQVGRLLVADGHDGGDLREP